MVTTAIDKHSILTSKNKPTRIAVNAGAIPEQLKWEARWVCWQYEWKVNKEGKGKWQKVPYMVNGARANNDQNTWTTFDRALQASDGFDGIGFVLGDGFTGIDLDNCRDVETGALTSTAQNIITRCQSYTEVSPTGTGVKMLVLGEKPQGRCKCDDPEVELYSGGRYFTVTGWHLEETPQTVTHDNGIIGWVYSTYIQHGGNLRDVQYTSSTVASDAEVARDALQHIPTKYASNHTDWVRVGYAAKSTDENLRDDWVAWSRKGDGYVDDADCLATWAKIKPDGTLGIGTLVHLAMESGWKPARQETRTTSTTTLVNPSNPDERFAKIREHYERPINLHELLDANFNDEYIIEDCLVAGQPSTTSGASKAMKTWIEAARAVALISGKPFLGRFAVNRPCSVFFATAESGKATVQRTIRAIARWMDVDLRAIDPGMLTFCWWVPRVSDAELLDYFAYEAEKSKAEVCTIDPLYQVLDDAQSSYILNGRQLADLSNRILALGATPILVDHAKRSSQNVKEFEPLELEDISGAGKAEYFRQWLLVSRRSKFAPEPGQPRNHELWLTLGGSAGHASTWALDIEETIHSDRSRDYEVATAPRSEVVQQRSEARKEQAKSKADQRAEALEARMQRKADELIENIYKGDRFLALTQNDIEGRVAVTGKEVTRVIGILINDGRLRKVPKGAEKNGRKYDAYMLGDSVGSGAPWDPNFSGE
ncbi:MAG: PriCT-2 domain-containing protein [Aureliella sp.]